MWCCRSRYMLPGVLLRCLLSRRQSEVASLLHTPLQIETLSCYIHILSRMRTVIGVLWPTDSEFLHLEESVCARALLHVTQAVCAVQTENANVNSRLSYDSALPENQVHAALFPLSSLPSHFSYHKTIFPLLRLITRDIKRVPSVTERTSTLLLVNCNKSQNGLPLPR